MRLTTAHKVMMVTAIGFGTFFSIWSGSRYTNTGSSNDLVMSVIGGATTLGLIVYFRFFLRKLRKSKP